MRRGLTIVVSNILLWLGLGWELLDKIGRTEVFFKLPDLAKHAIHFIGQHQDVSWQIAPWAMVAIGTAFLAYLQWPSLFGVLRNVTPTPVATPSTPNIASALYNWFKPKDALLILAPKAMSELHTTLTHKLSEAEQAAELARLAWGAACDAQPQTFIFPMSIPPHPDNDSLRDKMVALTQERDVQRRSLVFMVMEMTRGFHDQLASGELIAKGINLKDLSGEVLIPTFLWRMMQLDFETEVAKGEGISYGGVRIAKA